LDAFKFFVEVELALAKLDIEVKRKGWTTGVQFLVKGIIPVVTPNVAYNTLTIPSGPNKGTYDPIRYFDWHVPFDVEILTMPFSSNEPADTGLTPKAEIAGKNIKSLSALSDLLTSVERFVPYGSYLQISIGNSDAAVMYVPYIRFQDKSGVIISNQSDTLKNSPKFIISTFVYYFQTDDSMSHGSTHEDALYYPFKDIR